MESNQLNNPPNEEAVIEALTLTCEVNEHGTKYYKNFKGELHRIYGPAVTWPGGTEYWYKNGVRHREDGPARIFYRSGLTYYYINGEELTKNQFIRWQKDNGIKTNE